jgi:hypothetical protein
MRSFITKDRPMSTDTIVGAMVGMSVDRTQNALQATMMRQQVQAEQEFVATIASFAQASPAPGTGNVVDKTA